LADLGFEPMASQLLSNFKPYDACVISISKEEREMKTKKLSETIIVNVFPNFVKNYSRISIQIKSSKHKKENYIKTHYDPIVQKQ
jgi:hypothetical protein